MYEGIGAVSPTDCAVNLHLFFERSVPAATWPFGRAQWAIVAFAIGLCALVAGCDVEDEPVIAMNLREVQPPIGPAPPFEVDPEATAALGILATATAAHSELTSYSFKESIREILETDGSASSPQERYLFAIGGVDRPAELHKRAIFGSTELGGDPYCMPNATALVADLNLIARSEEWNRCFGGLPVLAAHDTGTNYAPDEIDHNWKSGPFDWELDADSVLDDFLSDSPEDLVNGPAVQGKQGNAEYSLLPDDGRDIELDDLADQFVSIRWGGYRLGFEGEFELIVGIGRSEAHIRYIWLGFESFPDFGCVAPDCGPVTGLVIERVLEFSDYEVAPRVVPATDLPPRNPACNQTSAGESATGIAHNPAAPLGIPGSGSGDSGAPGASSDCAAATFYWQAAIPNRGQVDVGYFGDTVAMITQTVPEIEYTDDYVIETRRGEQLSVLQLQSTGAWELQSQLSFPSRAGESRGKSVAVTDGYIVVGDPNGMMERCEPLAPGTSELDRWCLYVRSGAAYVFTNPDGNWSTPDEIVQLDHPEVEEFDKFGFKVEASGSTVVVVSESDDGAKVYGFEMHPEGWQHGYSTFTLNTPNAWRITDLSIFDSTVAVLRVVPDRIGSPWTVPIAHVFEEPADGWSGQAEAVSIFADPRTWSIQPTSIAAYEDRVAVGFGPFELAERLNGRVEVYVQDHGEWVPKSKADFVLELESRLRGGQVCRAEHFGHEVAVNGTGVLASSWGGCAYWFPWVDGAYESSAKEISGTDPDEVAAIFGRTFALDDSQVFIESRRCWEGQSCNRLAYVFPLVSPPDRSPQLDVDIRYSVEQPFNDANESIEMSASVANPGEESIRGVGLEIALQDGTGLWPLESLSVSPGCALDEVVRCGVGELAPGEAASFQFELTPSQSIEFGIKSTVRVRTGDDTPHTRNSAYRWLFFTL